VAGTQGGDIGIAYCRMIGHAPLDPGLDRCEFAIEHPEQQAERPEVLAAATFGFAESKRFDRLQVEVSDIGLDQLEVIERIAVSRVLVVARLRQISRSKAVAVENDQRARFQHRQADLERCRVERDKHIRCVTGCRYRLASQVDLVGGYAKSRSGRCTDFGRIVRERREVAPRERRRDRELRSHELYSVSGVAGKAHDD
jgi:hypothetical protein